MMNHQPVKKANKKKGRITIIKKKNIKIVSNDDDDEPSKQSDKGKPVDSDVGSNRELKVKQKRASNKKPKPSNP